ncbi:heterokaryon incompatibility protein-domain-containing protein [Xylariales sp. PMI_506]|nr:heterokaryon incompatibility protein-domain-containing protein [Xylariales sp. PMI_506]
MPKRDRNLLGFFRPSRIQPRIFLLYLRSFPPVVRGNNTCHSAPQDRRAIIAMGHNDVYIQCPVKPEEIRLLTICSGNTKDPIICKLESVHFPSHTDNQRIHDLKYKALSYTWGTDRNSCSIKCNDSSLGITRNLFEALLHLRHEQSPEVFWIDAICINQEDTDEKNSQIPRMRQIYTDAAETILWLGRSDFFSRRAFKSAASPSWPSRRLQQHELDATAARSRRRLSWLWTSIDALVECADYVAVTVLLRRVYFTRIWVVQEFALSPNPVFAAGRETLRFEVLASVAERIKRGLLADQNAWHLSKITSLRSTSPALLRQTDTVHSGVQCYLLALATLLRSSHSTDPRDKLFGLLGLCEESAGAGAYGLEAHYGKRVSDVYTQFAAVVIERRQSLDILGLVQSRCVKSAIALPSWVPDWSNVDVIPVSLSGHEHRRFSAAGNSRPPQISFMECEIKLPSKVLCISGYEVDTIAELGSEGNTEVFRRKWSFYLFFLWRYPDSHLLRVICEWERQFRESGVPNFEQTFAATLIASNDDESKTSSKLVLPAINRFRHRQFSDTPLFIRMFQTILIYLVVRSGISASTRSSDGFRIVLITAFAAVAMFFSLTLTFAVLIPNSGWEDAVVGECRVVELRRIARTQAGRLALVPASASQGDTIALCRGSSVPLVLRRRGKYFDFVGESYVSEMMDGKAFMEDRCEPTYII